MRDPHTARQELDVLEECYVEDTRFVHDT